MEDEVRRIIEENGRRNAAIKAPFNPITGEGSLGRRVRVEISDFPLGVQWIPEEMMQVELVRGLVEAGSIADWLSREEIGEEEQDAEEVAEAWVRVRIRYDFAFWAASLAWIKGKGGGSDVLLWLNRPQRKLVDGLERMRKAGKPIRLVLLKARQWGGSTAIQLYMAWLQLVHMEGLNSLIVGHVKDVSVEVKDMLAKLLDNYPAKLLHQLGEPWSDREAKLVGVGQTGNIQRIPQRNCKIKIGSAEKPDSARGGDYNLVHCTEVGLWKTTEGKTPAQIVRSACSGVLLNAMTMIVYESTANGTGNFFQREYDAAKRGQSQMEALFIPWFEIEQYAIPIANVTAFARELYANRENPNVRSEREESGQYLWWLWEKGATLEAIAWYILERAKYTDHGDMASEYPSDDIEAFVHSGARVFDKYKVESLRRTCKPARWTGELQARGDEGESALEGLHFVEDRQGRLSVWAKPDTEGDERVANRYLVVVDIGGRGRKSDWSVILVLDRLNQMDGGRPVVVAQWYGHIDMDRLAWKAAQIAAWYDDALLVIESNTLETHDKERQVDGDMSGYILNQVKGVYDNLYARAQSDEEIRAGEPKKWGFHTNVATKPKIISTLVKVVRDGLYVERDERALDEYLCYERKKNGAYGAISGKHDDLLMTRAIGLHIAFYEMDEPRIVAKRETRKPKARASVGAVTV